MSKKAVAELSEWVVMYRGLVDRGAFIEACDRILGEACVERGMRVPASVMGKGIVTLDVACALIGMFVPAEIVHYCHRLPGSADYIAANLEAAE